MMFRENKPPDRTLGTNALILCNVLHGRCRRPAENQIAGARKRKAGKSAGFLIH
jgi:hypothetical protein